MKPVITTFMGNRVNPLDMREFDIDIRDIAHALALCNRFAGHSKKPISVAQHSVFVSYLCDDTPYALQALLHDASEAYLGDMTKWVKQTPELAGYREIEDRLERLIYKRFRCPLVIREEVVAADRLMVLYEIERGYDQGVFVINHPDYPPLTNEQRDQINTVEDWAFWGWQHSELSFLSRFDYLVNRDE